MSGGVVLAYCMDFCKIRCWDKMIKCQANHSMFRKLALNKTLTHRMSKLEKITPIVQGPYILLYTFSLNIYNQWKCLTFSNTWQNFALNDFNVKQASDGSLFVFHWILGTNMHGLWKKETCRENNINCE